MDLLITNARVVTCDGPEDAGALERLDIRERSAVGVEDGRIVFVGPDEDVRRADATHVIDADGGCLMPGLVDTHTHLVFGGSRVDEFARRMAGEDYRTIAAEGGGIAATVRATREADDDTLYRGAAARARVLRAQGVTSVEVKSGYGLNTEQELRLLRIANRLDAEQVVRVTPTFLGAHALPPERKDDRTGYVDEIVAEMIPAVAREALADACDVYLEGVAFTLDESRRILETAKAAGMAVRGHIGQFEDLGGAELLAELGALSADHLEALSEAGARALAEAGVVGVLLPGAWRTLRQQPPDVERMRAAGMRLAVATDCNPGTSPCTDLPLCAALSVRDAGLTLEEAVLGVTVEAARAAGLRQAGRIAPGLPADLALYAHDDPRALAYAVGGIEARATILGGRVVHEASRLSLAVW